MRNRPLGGRGAGARRVAARAARTRMGDGRPGGRRKRPPRALPASRLGTGRRTGPPRLRPWPGGLANSLAHPALPVETPAARRRRRRLRKRGLPPAQVYPETRGGRPEVYPETRGCARRCNPKLISREILYPRFRDTPPWPSNLGTADSRRIERGHKKRQGASFSCPTSRRPWGRGRVRRARPIAAAAGRPVGGRRPRGRAVAWGGASEPVKGRRLARVRRAPRDPSRRRRMGGPP